MVISGGAAILHACPRSVALGLLPLALARFALAPTHEPATHAPVALYAPAASAPAAARGGGEALALGLRALRRARELTGWLTWGVLSKVPVALRHARELTGWLVWGVLSKVPVALRHARELTEWLVWSVLSKVPTPSAWLRWGGEACGAALWAGGRSLSLGRRLGWWAVDAVARAASLAGTAVGVG